MGSRTAAALCFALAASPAAANIYLFRVDCGTEAFVAQWQSGSPDPGRDYFRIATGDVNLDCSIANYDPRTDRTLPQRACVHPGGLVRGFPPALILLGRSHCR